MKGSGSEAPDKAALLLSLKPPTELEVGYSGRVFLQEPAVSSTQSLYLQSIDDGGSTG